MGFITVDVNALNFVLNQSDFKLTKTFSYFWGRFQMGWCFVEFSLKSCLLIFKKKTTPYVCCGPSTKKKKNEQVVAEDAG